MNRLKYVRPRLTKIGTSGVPVSSRDATARRRTNWWRAIAVATIVGALIGPSAAHAVNGIDLPGLNITKDGLEVQAGNFSVDAGRSTFGNPTGPTPAAGGINAQAIAVNGTPVIVGGTPTPLPTCPSNQYLIGPGEPGSTCATPLPTSTPANTATPIPSQIAGVVTTATPATNTILYFPGVQGTPGIYVTPSAGGSSTTGTNGTTYLAANVGFTGGFDSGPNTGSIGGSGQTIQLNAGACFSTAAGATVWLMEITDGTTVFIEHSYDNAGGTQTIECHTLGPVIVSPSGAATYTLKIQNKTAANGAILASDPGGATSNKSTYISWVRMS